MNLIKVLLCVAFIFRFTSVSFSQSSNNDQYQNQYLLLSSGLLFSKSKVSDPKNLLESMYTESFTVKAAFQKQLLKRIYCEASLTYNDYWIGYNINDGNPTFLGVAISAFGSIEGSYGFIYKIETKKNRDVLNFHLGLFAGYAFSSNGQTGNVGFYNESDWNEGDFIKQLEGKVNQRSLFLLGNSIGISRDFRITENLDFGLNFNYNLGYNKLTEIDIEYLTSKNAALNSANVSLSATSWQSLIYAKVRINDVRKND